MASTSLRYIPITTTSGSLIFLTVLLVFEPVAGFITVAAVGLYASERFLWTQKWATRLRRMHQDRSASQISTQCPYGQAQLRALGVSVSIDDFGTGYSSLAYLRQLPVSVIKIDMSFVSGMLTNDNDAVLVRTIVDMAHNLGHTLVAEGVETSLQHEQLAALGCELGQGYLFGKPVSAEEFAARWLELDKK